MTLMKQMVLIKPILQIEQEYLKLKKAILTKHCSLKNNGVFAFSNSKE